MILYRNQYCGTEKYKRRKKRAEKYSYKEGYTCWLHTNPGLIKTEIEGKLKAKELASASVYGKLLKTFLLPDMKE